MGLSSTDYYGHPFGPDSKEIADGIVRLDATLDAFFSWLDEKVGAGSALVFLTADHGVTPIPEVARARYRLRTGTDDPSIAGRVDLDNRGGDSGLVSDDSADRLALERDLAKRFRYDLSEGQSNFHDGAVLFFEEPGLYLNKAVLARRRVSIEAAKDAARDFVRRLPGVLAAYTNTEIGDGLPAGTPFALAIARSFRADRSGDVFVVLRPGWMWSYGKNAGTTHGQPGDDDSRVPLAIFGPGVVRGSFDLPVSPLSIARTIAALFGFEAGEPDAVVLDAVVGQTTPRGRPLTRGTRRPPDPKTHESAGRRAFVARVDAGNPESVRLRGGPRQRKEWCRHETIRHLDPRGRGGARGGLPAPRLEREDGRRRSDVSVQGHHRQRRPLEGSHDARRRGEGGRARRDAEGHRPLHGLRADQRSLREAARRHGGQPPQAREQGDAHEGPDLPRRARKARRARARQEDQGRQRPRDAHRPPMERP